MTRVFLVVAALLVSGCADKSGIERLEWPVMGTVAAVQSRGGDADGMKRAVSEVKSVFAEIERLLNAHDPESELSRLAGLPDGEILRRCSPVVRPCYEAAFKMRDQTGGRFDPRWKGFGTLDLGAIAKGFAVDLACDKVKDCGFELLIDLGGNLKAVSGRWRTLIAGADETLTLADGMACATSAEYFRGRHIRDAKSRGAPAGSGSSVTVVHPHSAMLADALSTVMFIAGRERGEEFRRRHYPQADVIWSKSAARLAENEPFGYNVGN
jgi:thiamine biosynthesis lipoprotein